MKIIKLIFLSLICITFCGCINITTETNFDIKKVSFDQNAHECVILGGGIGGLSSSIYIGMAGYKPLIIQGDIPGGLITQSTNIENWPGEIKISGLELTNKIRSQALAHGAKILNSKVIDVNFKTWPYSLKIENLDNHSIREIKALTCIIAMGSNPNFLNIPGETGPNGYFCRGVSTCAICDGNFYKDKIVGVVGGGDAAATESLYLSKIAKKVFIFVRSDKLRAKFSNQETIKSTPNIEVLFNTKIVKINGDGKKVTSISTLNTKTNTEKDLDIDVLFLAIGSMPNTEFFKNQITLDENGYIKLFNQQETSIKGIFAAGDICNPKIKQAITASGQGVWAALQSIDFLQEIGYNPQSKTTDIQNTGIQKESVKTNQNVVLEIETDKQFNDMLKNNEFVLADIYGETCPPCKKMAPIFHDLAKEFYEKVVFAKISVQKNFELAQRYSIQSVPTFMFFKKGSLVKKTIGSCSYDDLKKEIEKLL